jgi:hypothetical protein
MHAYFLRNSETKGIPGVLREGFGLTSKNLGCDAIVSNLIVAIGNRLDEQLQAPILAAEMLVDPDIFQQV